MFSSAKMWAIKVAGVALAALAIVWQLWRRAAGQRDEARRESATRERQAERAREVSEAQSEAREESAEADKARESQRKQGDRSRGLNNDRL